MRKVLQKRLISFLLVFSMLFMFCMMAYADYSTIGITNRASPVIQSNNAIAVVDVMLSTTFITLIGLSVFITRIRGSTTNYKVLPITNSFGVNNQLHIDPGRQT